MAVALTTGAPDAHGVLNNTGKRVTVHAQVGGQKLKTVVQGCCVCGEINVVKSFLTPALGLVAVLIVSVFLTWTYYFRGQMRPIWTPEMTFSGNLDDQRHMASCYDAGCRDVIATPILACAWREVILEESHRSSTRDITAAAESCQKISKTDRQILKRAETDIRARLHSVQPAQDLNHKQT